MFEIKTAILITLAHIVLYSYLVLIHDFLKIGTITNTKNEIIYKLRTEFNVGIKTFKKNCQPLGFCTGTFIYLNEVLFKDKDRLMFAFYHELYHLKHHHRNTLIAITFLFSLIPLATIILPWYYVLAFYVCFAYFKDWMQHTRFEAKANEYAKQQTNKD